MAFGAPSVLSVRAARGSVQLAAIGKALKAQSAPAGLRLELSRGLKAGARPLVKDVKAAALTQLPQGGGLNRQVAGQRVTVSVRMAGRNAGVRLVTTAPDTSQTDRGFVRHPTFGRRGKGDWKTERIPAAAGWWSKTLEEKSPLVTRDLLAVQARVSHIIELAGRL